ncbi:collagen alpha-1(I) chain-like [Homarus americanus]|uniref:collagen alpha-1(I) chain-like n=1 Tax=Homarus americanus TaxID=6706 RepID=UPI001C46E2C7|nr:collagen alpha-1(I) chain-like [Homarus americanus]
MTWAVTSQAACEGNSAQGPSGDGRSQGTSQVTEVVGPQRVAASGGPTTGALGSRQGVGRSQDPARGSGAPVSHHWPADLRPSRGGGGPTDLPGRLAHPSLTRDSTPWALSVSGSNVLRLALFKVAVPPKTPPKGSQLTPKGPARRGQQLPGALPWGSIACKGHWKVGSMEACQAVASQGPLPGALQAQVSLRAAAPQGPSQKAAGTLEATVAVTGLFTNMGSRALPRAAAPLGSPPTVQALQKFPGATGAQPFQGQWPQGPNLGNRALSGQQRPCPCQGLYGILRAYSVEPQRHRVLLGAAAPIRGPPRGNQGPWSSFGVEALLDPLRGSDAPRAPGIRLPASQGALLGRWRPGVFKGRGPAPKDLPDAEGGTGSPHKGGGVFGTLPRRLESSPGAAIPGTPAGAVPPPGPSTGGAPQVPTDPGRRTCRDLPEVVVALSLQGRLRTQGPYRTAPHGASLWW